MTQYIIVILFFILAFIGMALALHFSQFKKRSSGCCGGGHCETNNKSRENQHSCYDEKVDFVKNHQSLPDA